MTDDIQSFNLEETRERMYADIANLCRQWIHEGIDPKVVCARLTYAALEVNESLGLECESVVRLVKKFYGVLPLEAPKAKA